MEGVKATLSLHIPPGASGEAATQLVVVEKLPASGGGVIATAVICSGAVPMLVTVTVCAVLFAPWMMLPNARLTGVREAVGTVPVPERETIWVALVPLAVPGPVPPLSSVKVSVPVAGPDALGAKFTVSVQVPPAAIGEAETQLVVVWKVAVGEETATDEMWSGFWPVFVTVTVMPLLVVLTG
jgi:hypothetical protein